jgi:hypothetical protein
MAKAVHIFHHNDLDGRASGGLWYEYFNRYRDDVSMYFMHEIDYRAHLNEKIYKDDIVVFVDYSFSSEDNLKYFKDLINGGYEVYWIDHHATSVDVLDKLIMVDSIRLENFHYKIDTSYCATYLSYQFIYDKLIKNINPIVIPEVVKYIDSYDCWKMNMPDTIAFDYGINGLQYTAKNFFRTQVFNDICFNIFMYGDDEQKKEAEFIARMIDTGSKVQEYNATTNLKSVKACGFPVQVVDDVQDRAYIGFAMNVRGNSLVFGDLINKYDFVLSFIHTNNHIWKYSIFSATEKDVDCAYLAKIFGKIDNLGGGGHIHAAGFQTKTCIFDKGDTIDIRKPLLSSEAKVTGYSWMEDWYKAQIRDDFESPKTKKTKPKSSDD